VAPFDRWDGATIDKEVGRNACLDCGGKLQDKKSVRKNVRLMQTAGFCFCTAAGFETLGRDHNFRVSFRWWAEYFRTKAT
jgi:hypothetical protein